MSTSPPLAGRSVMEERTVFASLPNAQARRRLEAVLRGHATLRWFDSFGEMRLVLEGGDRPTAAVVALSDATGASVLDFAREVREEMTGTPIVVYCDLGRDGRAPITALAESGVHDVLVIGLNDDGYTAREVIFGAALGGAADVVVRMAETLIPHGLLPFVEAAVRQPRDIQRVSDLAAAMHMPRQTLGRWCREHQYLRPEELLMWVRLFLVGVLLETTTRTVESIAIDLHYGSATSLRNRISDYTGMTATEIRVGGFEVLLSAFRQRVDQVRLESELRESSAKVG